MKDLPLKLKRPIIRGVYTLVFVFVFNFERSHFTYVYIFLRYTVEWIGREGLDPETHGEYLQHFITHFYKNITKLVDRAMRKEDSSAQGQIVTEILQHLHACNNSVRVIIFLEVGNLFNYECFYVKSNSSFILQGVLWARGKFEKD